MRPTQPALTESNTASAKASKTSPPSSAHARWSAEEPLTWTVGVEAPCVAEWLLVAPSGASTKSHTRLRNTGNPSLRTSPVLRWRARAQPSQRVVAVGRVGDERILQEPIAVSPPLFATTRCRPAASHLSRRKVSSHSNSSLLSLAPPRP